MKPHILIDARLYGPSHTGIGRYVQNLLKYLITQPNFKNYRWSLLVYPELLDQIKNNLGTNFEYHQTNIRHYTLLEQILLPSIIYQLHPHLYHVPHFNKPILYFGKTVVTIHDLIKHFSKGKATTTKNQFFYWPKYFLYLLLTRLTINHNHLIVPTNFWRQYIIDNYHISPQKIITTNEAVDQHFLNPKNSKLDIKNYLLYTGTLYPHKNLQVVFEALKNFPDLKLKIISKPSIFLDRTKNIAEKLQLQNQVEFLGFVKDQDFFKLYQQAFAFIFPSLMEGFGLPGLEAMSMGCPVISSNASCLPEVQGDAALYFDPQNSNDLVIKIKLLKSDPKLRSNLIKNGFTQVKKYDWKTTAKQTLYYYESIICS